MQLSAINDEFRKMRRSGSWMFTAGFRALPDAVQAKFIKAINDFDDFDTEENDPHAEHDFGAIEIDGVRVFWKIDYYNLTMDGLSEDPTDDNKTKRVITIMLASEY